MRHNNFGKGRGKRVYNGLFFDDEKNIYWFYENGRWVNVTEEILYVDECLAELFDDDEKEKLKKYE